MKRPIFLLGAHKSGSSLLRSLFDGHPQLFTIPLETHIFKAAGYWVDYRLGEAGPLFLTPQEIAHNYLKIIGDYNERHMPLSDADLRDKFNLLRVQSRLLDNSTVNMSFEALIERYFQSIYFGLHGTEFPAQLRIVEKSVEHVEFAQDLKRLFPDAVFVHIVRNPYSHLVSLRLMQASNTGRQFPYLGKVIATLNNSYYYLYRNRRFISDYLVIRYEDLLTSTERVMQKVVEFIGIDFVKSLMTPTSVGQVWEGNSSRGSKFSGVAETNLYRWQDQITSLEVDYVNKYLDFVVEDFGYRREFPKRSRWWPVWYESPPIYIANRLIPYEYARR